MRYRKGRNTIYGIRTNISTKPFFWRPSRVSQSWFKIASRRRWYYYYNIVAQTSILLQRKLTDLEGGPILDNDIVHVVGLEVVEAFGERNEVQRVIWPVKLDQVRPVRVVVTGPSRDQWAAAGAARRSRSPGWTGGRRGPWGGRRVRWLCRVAGWRVSLLEGFTGRVGDQSSYALLVEYPHAGHLDR